MAECLAAAGHRVTFVELPSLRQVAQRSYWLSAAGAPGVEVVRPWPLPWRLRSREALAVRAWTAWTSRILRRRIGNGASSVLVTSTPWWLPMMKALPAACRCYDYLDHVDVQAGPGRIELFTRWDAELLAHCDVVTTVSEPLRRDLATRVPADRLALVPNGVCAEWLGRRVAPLERRQLTPHPQRPIAGFLGALFEWVDVDLIAAAARRLPDVEFAIVGPTRRGVSMAALAGLANVHCHPAVPFARVPEVIAAFDVSLIPFKRDLIAEFADPLKVYEYCALGRPVVSTVLFNAGGPEPPVSVAVGAEAFAEAIRRALREDSETQRAERISFARRHTWEIRAEEFTAATAGGIAA